MVLCTNVPPSVHTLNGHLPFIILGGQPASTLHADQGFGAREKAGRAYSAAATRRVFDFVTERARYRSVLRALRFLREKRKPNFKKMKRPYRLAVSSLNLPKNRYCSRPRERKRDRDRERETARCTRFKHL